MMTKLNLTITKMDWELGADFGCVYYPKTVEEFQNKVQQLNTKGQIDNYPFQVCLFFEEPSLWLGFTVGHFYSLFLLYIGDQNNRYNIFHVINLDGSESEVIPIYYMTSYTEPDTRRMLPLHQIIEAIVYFIANDKFPSYIQFDDEKINEQFVENFGEKQG